MTHPALVPLEDLVNRLLEAMQAHAEESGADLVNAAREYAESCETINERLNLCLNILSKGSGQAHQALMAATRAPDLLDACAVLSELQTDDYQQFCRERHLPLAPGLNERAKQAVDPLYERAGSFQKKLRMEFSAANSKRDFREALDICRQLAKVDPTDASSVKQAAALEERLIQEVLTKQAKPALDRGDDEEVLAALNDIERIAPGRAPRPDERGEALWREAVEHRKTIRKEEAVIESAKFLEGAESAREDTDLPRVIDLLARISALQSDHGFEFSIEKSTRFEALEDWKLEELKKARIAENFQSALKDLEKKLRSITDKEFQATPPTPSENEADALELQRLWREIAEFKKPVSPELQERARKSLADLTEKVDRHKRAKRRNLSLMVLVGAIVLTATATIAVFFQRSAKASSQLAAAIEDGRADDLRDKLEVLENEAPAWSSLGSLPRTRENANVWLEEQEALSARMTGVLSSIRGDFDSREDLSTWTPISLEAMKNRLHEAGEEIDQVNPNDRTPLEERLTSLLITWDSLAETRRNEIAAAFRKDVENLDQRMRSELRFDRPSSELLSVFDEMSPVFLELGAVATTKLEELSPAASDVVKFGVLQARFEEFEAEVKNIRSVMNEVTAADSLEGYSKAIRELNTTDFLEGQQKIALSNLLVEADSSDRIFREILMPEDIVSWKHLTERTYAPAAFPGDMNEHERVTFLGFRDDESLGEIYRYSITEGGKTRSIFSRGGTMEGVDLTSGGAQVYEMEGKEVYDPEGSSLATVSFRERSYQRAKSAQGARGVIPTGGDLSAESNFFQSLNIGDYATEEFTGFRRPFLEIAEEVLKAPNDINLLFRAYLFLETGKLVQPRPEKWLYRFTSFSDDLAELEKIVGPGVTSSDWCSSAKTEMFSSKLNQFFESRSKRKYVKEATAVYSFYARIYTGGLHYAGYQGIDEKLQLSQSTGAATSLWGLDPQFKILRAFEKSDDGKWGSLGEVSAFSPVFYLRADPSLTWQSVAKDHFLDPDDPETLKRLPTSLKIN